MIASPPADQPADHIGEEALSRCKAFAAWFFGDEAGPAPESVTPLDLRVLLSLIARQQETIRADGEALSVAADVLLGTSKRIDEWGYGNHEVDWLREKIAARLSARQGGGS